MTREDSLNNSIREIFLAPHFFVDLSLVPHQAVVDGLTQFTVYLDSSLIMLTLAATMLSDLFSRWLMRYRLIHKNNNHHETP